MIINPPDIPLLKDIIPDPCIFIRLGILKIAEFQADELAILYYLAIHRKQIISE